jgi:RNA polymerase sigma-70 factor (ECF subfamily)
VRSFRAEFEAALLPHLEAMARLARFLMRGNRADAEDLVQDAVLRAFQAFPRFQPGTNLRAWLFRILRNTYVDLLRKRGRHAEVMDLEEMAPEDDPAVEEFRAQVAREGTEADLEAALAQLPAELRIALLLVDGEGLHYDEVAQILECPVGQLLEIWRREASP